MSCDDLFKFFSGHFHPPPILYHSVTFIPQSIHAAPILRNQDPAQPPPPTHRDPRPSARRKRHDLASVEFKVLFRVLPGSFWALRESSRPNLAKSIPNFAADSIVRAGDRMQNSPLSPIQTGWHFDGLPLLSTPMTMNPPCAFVNAQAVSVVSRNGSTVSGKRAKKSAKGLSRPVQSHKVSSPNGLGFARKSKTKPHRILLQLRGSVVSLIRSTLSPSATGAFPFPVGSSEIPRPWRRMRRQWLSY